jgi:hypothetical protein
MTIQFNQVAADAMKLSLRERVRLTQLLTSTLVQESETDVEELWFIEARRRLDELHSRRIEGVDVDRAFRTVREESVNSR